MKAILIIEYLNSKILEYRIIVVVPEESFFLNR